jgi:hypothetical protein
MATNQKPKGQLNMAKFILRITGKMPPKNYASIRRGK